MSEIFKGSWANMSPGETVTADVGKFRYVATIHHDSDTLAPWQEYDHGHGPVRTVQLPGGYLKHENIKRPGERVLFRDRHYVTLYDVEAAQKQALNEGWHCTNQTPTMTRRQVAARAVEADFQYLKGWCDDEWVWVGVAVQVFLGETPLTDEYDFAIWCIESTAGDYLREVANECADDAYPAAVKKLEELVGMFNVAKFEALGKVAEKVVAGVVPSTTDKIPVATLDENNDVTGVEWKDKVDLEADAAFIDAMSGPRVEAEKYIDEKLKGQGYPLYPGITREEAALIRAALYLWVATDAGRTTNLTSDARVVILGEAFGGRGETLMNDEILKLIERLR